MSGESQILLTVIVMLGGTVGFAFRYLSNRITKVVHERDELEKVVIKQSNVLARIDEVNRKMEQWYEKNIPELHAAVKALHKDMADARVSVARLKILTCGDAAEILKKESEKKDTSG